MIKFIRQHRHLKALCKQQAKELSDKGELIAELIAENYQLKLRYKLLKDSIKIEEDKTKVYEILADKMNFK